MGSIARRTAIRTAAAAVALTAVSALGLSISPAAASAPISSPASSQNPLDQLGRPTPQTQAQIRDFANQPWLPAQMRDAILSALAAATALQPSAASGPFPFHVAFVEDRLLTAGNP